MYGSVGSSVTFTWRFSGGVGTVEWGVKDPAVTDVKTRLVFLSSTGAVLAVTTEDPYNGRVNGSYHGDASTGQAIFKLSNIRKGDKGFYICKIKSSDFVPVIIHDPVELTIEGE